MPSPHAESIHKLGAPHKYELIDRLLPTASLLDAGGIWGVHGAYALHAALGGTPRVVVVDTHHTPEFEEWRRDYPVEYLQHELNDIGWMVNQVQVETSLCFEVLMHQALPLLTLHVLTSCTSKQILLTASVLPEDRFQNSNSAVFLPGLPPTERPAIHPKEGDPSFKVFSDRPEDARNHSEWHWALSSSLIVSLMAYLGWGLDEQGREPFHGSWDWWWGRFRPDPDLRF